MATSTIGNIDCFDENLESWESYCERLGQFFEANGVEDEKKRASLLSLIGPKAYTLLKNLCAPAKPADKSYDDLVAMLNAQLNPKPSIIAERYRFHKRNQGQTETVMEYVAELRKLSIHCKFEAVLNDTLRDRLVCGLKHEYIQKKLLSETDLDLDKAIKVSVGMETATKDAAEVHGMQNQVHKVNMKYKNKSKFKPPLQHPQAHNPMPPRKMKCYRCDGDHMASSCRFSKSICNFCKKIGHIEKACLKKKHSAKNLHAMYMDEEPILHVDKLDKSDTHAEAILLKPTLDDVQIEMELDTGTALSIISEDVYRSKLWKNKLRKTKTVLKSYSGHTVTPIGKLNVNVKINNQSAKVDLYVVPHNVPSLFGRDWLQSLKLNWVEIKSLRPEGKRLHTILEKHKTVFDKGIGKLKDIKADLTFKEGTQPKFIKARTVPYTLQPQIEDELNRLQTEGIIEPIEHSEWATPIVPVIKKNGNVRICGDYRVTLNAAICVDKYPLPKIEDIFAGLSGGEKFSKIDLTQAYLQMEINEKSKQYLVVNTHKGLYRYNRLVFGISSAPSVWQRAIDQVLQNVPFTKCILDDIIISGKNDDEHLNNLNLVLERLESYGLRANLDKCTFFQDKISYCGHDIDKNGLHKSPSKVKAMNEVARPENVSQLRSFLGLVNYYHRFVENLSSIAASLHELLQSNTKWMWTEQCEVAFLQIKDAICSEQVLCHYNPTQPLKLACDASPYGIGCVLSHTFPDGSERPIAFVSRSLNKAEKGYSQIDKEALSLYWGVRKFNTYLYGQKFTLVTDHKPLLSIFNPSKALPVMTAARLQRYAVFLSGYTYDIQYKGTKQHANADALSRLPLPEESDELDDPTDIFYSAHFNDLPVTSIMIRRETQRDRILSQVLDFVMQGHFPETDDITLKPYLQRKSELNVHQGCLLWGNRVIIPDCLREKVINEIHSGHIGVVKMKSLSRSYVWWPKLDNDIEELCRSCYGCKSVKNSQPSSTVHPWSWPGSPWYRLHIDFAGPFKGAMFLIVVDAYSKWPEVFHMMSTTTTATVNVLRTLFARQGLPSEIVSDNGPQFRSEEFKTFMESNGIRHMTSAPFHPRTNGQAERFVQSFKNAIKASSDGTMNQKLNAFLCKYRITPHGTTNESPSILLYGRNIRTRLDILKPNTRDIVNHKQMEMMNSKHVDPPIKQYEIGQPVLTRDYRSNQKWTSGQIQSKTGPLSYKVGLGNGVVWRRHIDQLQPSTDTPETTVTIPDIDLPSPVTIPLAITTSINDNGTVNSEEKTLETISPVRTPSKRYPQRLHRKAPNRLDL